MKSIQERYHQFDQWLLLNKPWLWETKVHLAVPMGLAIYSFLVLVYSIVGIGLGLMSLVEICMFFLSLGYWLVQFMKYKGEFQRRGAKAYQHQYWAIALSIFTLMTPALFARLTVNLSADANEIFNIGMIGLCIGVSFSTLGTLGLKFFKIFDWKRGTIFFAGYMLLGVIFTIVFLISVPIFMFLIVLLSMVLAVYFQSDYRISTFPAIHLWISSVAHFVIWLLCCKMAMFIGLPAILLIEGWLTALSVCVTIGVLIGTYAYVRLFYFDHQRLFLKHLQMPK